MKAITIICNISNSVEMNGFVAKVMTTAKYINAIQFIFFLQKDNKACIQLAHDLYMLYPPSMFDNNPATTIKIVLDDPQQSWESACIEKADAPIVLTKQYVESLFKKKSGKPWDLNYLDTEVDGVSPRKFHNIIIKEEKQSWLP